MKLAYTLLHRLCIPVMALLIFFSMPRCSKNPGPDHNKNDSDTTVPIPKHIDSMAFHVVFDMVLAKTSGVYQDSFEDAASMQIRIKNGVVTIPPDSIENMAPDVWPASGRDGAWSAVWVPDDIGEINITGATGLLVPVDSTVVITLQESGTISPKWQITFGSTTSSAGGDATPGWPLAFSFNPRLGDQDAFKLNQPGSFWLVWVYKDY
jgi:hypothetical protein